MRIKRSEILKAIRTEKLKAGEFIHTKRFPTGDLDEYGSPFFKFRADKTCKVCAVGAVLRNKNIHDENIHYVAHNMFFVDNPIGSVDQNGDEKNALLQKHYLAALSIKFEKLAAKLGCGKRTKNALIRFVKANFPKTINVKL